MMDPSMFMMGKGGAAFPAYGMGMQAGGNSPKGGGKGKNKGAKGGDAAGEKRAKGGKTEKKQRAKAKGRANSPPATESEDANINRSAVLIEVRKNHGKCKVPLADVMPHVLE